MSDFRRVTDRISVSPQIDLADIDVVVTAAAGLPDIDGERIAINGVSYGGLMTQWALANSNRSCAGSVRTVSRTY